MLTKSRLSVPPFPFRGREMVGCELYLPLWSPKSRGSPFRSFDNNHHVCTVYGALWTPNGRWFDGGGAADDKLTIPDVASIQNIFDGGGTVMFWINVASDGGLNEGRIAYKEGWFLQVFHESGEGVRLKSGQLFSVSDGSWYTEGRVLLLNTWTLVTLVYNSDADTNNPTFYLDTTAYAISDGLLESLTPSGTRTTDAGTDLLIGKHPAGAYVIDGTIGELWFYNRALTLPEIQHNYLSTRFRYQ